MPDLPALIRRVDEDRWLASRFAPEAVRARLVALYAFNYELAHAAEAAREPGLGAIRLKWWRDGLEEIAQGVIPRFHPALNAICATTPDSAFPRRLQALADARAADLEPAPFAAWEDMERYIDATTGLLVRLAVDACGVHADAEGAFLRDAARAWGFTGLLRAAGHWRLRGRTLLPPGARVEDLRARARAAYAAAKPAARFMKADAFPAFGYVALAPGYLRALENGRIDTPLMGRKALLIVASATGRI
jgi:phytoene synthase